jgi:D-3-phosphoglycerate dehydrogenase
MKTIRTYGNISPIGLGLFDNSRYEISDSALSYDAIMVHSHPLHDIEIPENLKAIVRVGAGVNTIPVDKCSELGIVVFNTPGGNANAVKELVLGVMIMAARNVVAASEWVKSLGTEVDPGKAVEKGKVKFRGPEIMGKSIGIIGVGAIGSRMAKACTNLGMQVYGYDPFLSKQAIENVKPYVNFVNDPTEIYRNCDYISMHVPLKEDTYDYIDKAAIEMMKPGVTIINYARGPVVNNEAIVEGLKSGKVRYYLTDFPTKEQLALENVLATPHLGAGTPEADENCAVMAANQLIDFLENGNITNSVNYPDVTSPRTGECRITICHYNKRGMLGAITNLISDAQINIANLVNRSKGVYAYTMIDLDSDALEPLISGLRALDGVIRVTRFD